MICEKENIEKTKKKEHIDKKARILPWLFFSLIILTTVWIRYNSLDIPLERDEGEYAYGGQILLQGIPPYKKLYNMKFPGIYAVYAGLMYLFGQTHTGIHFALLFVNLIATIFVYMIARKLYGLTGALTAAASFAILSVGQPVQGIFANAEHFVILPVLVGIFLLLQTNTKSRKYLLFLAGFFLGIGFIIKQHGIFFILFGAIFLCFEAFWNNQDTAKIRKIILKKTGLFFLGVLIPYLLTCLLLYRAGVFAKFWFWTMKYVGSYTTQRSLSQAWSTLKISFSSIFTASPLLWLLAVTGVFLVFTYKDRKKLVFIIGLFLFSFLAVCPGGFFRPHYFVLVLPVSALLIGLTIDFLDRLPYKKDMQWLRQWFPITLAVISLTVSLYIQRDFLFKMSLNQIITKIYWPNPFNESLEIARKIKEDCKPNDTIAIMGSEPQIFFYTGLYSASGYIYMYPLMEEHDFALTMQKELIREVEATKPAYLIFVHNPLSWLEKNNSHTLIYDWYMEYKKKYKPFGLVEMFGNKSHSYWDQAIIWPPTAPYWLIIMKRKETNSSAQG